MNALVVLTPQGMPVTTSLAIAEGVGNPHKSVIQLIRQNINDFNEFGRVAFEMRPFETAGGTQNREVAVINEQQATLLLTYMRNNNVVREFKKRLVKAFFEMANRQPADRQPLTPLDALKQIVATLEDHDDRLRRHEMEIAQLRMLRAPRRRLALVGNQVGLDLSPSAASKSDHKGGTHASPCLHVRKGHYRQYRGGKRVWVRPAQVGKNPAH